MHFKLKLIANIDCLHWIQQPQHLGVDVIIKSISESIFLLRSFPILENAIASISISKLNSYVYFFFLICTLSFSCSGVLSFSCPQPSSAVLRRVLLPGGRVTLFPVTPSEKLFQTHSSSVPEEQRDVEDVCLFFSAYYMNPQSAY